MLAGIQRQHHLQERRRPEPRARIPRIKCRSAVIPVPEATRSPNQIHRMLLLNNFPQKSTQKASLEFPTGASVPHGVAQRAG